MLLITGGILLTGQPTCPPIANGAVYVANGRIADLGDATQMEARYPQAERLDAAEQVVMPGLICAHTHFYGALARGMSLAGPPPSDFAQILARLWWRLDRALDETSITLSALVCLADAIRHGTTTLIDHHASPNAIDGSLDIIADAVRRAGLRASLCYEVSDRDGLQRARQGMRENERFIQKCLRTQRDDPSPPLMGALWGLHASFTLSDATLQTCAGRAADLGVGCHLHVAEGWPDVQDSMEKYGCRVVERLHRAGVLHGQTIAAHCVHIDERELDILAQTGVNVVHNPRSNMNNAVGAADLIGWQRRGCRVGLGNDGFSNNMWSEMTVASLLHKHVNGDPRILPADQVVQMVWQNNARIAACAGLPSQLGVLRVGAPADLILVRHHPITPLTETNWPWHVLMGMDGGDVETVMVGGRLLMHRRQLLTLDEAEIAAQARACAQQIWTQLGE